MSRRSGSYCAAAFCCLLLSGCTRKYADGDATVAVYQTWVGLSAVAGGLIATGVAAALRSKSAQVWVFLVIAALATVLFLPFGFVDYVRVTPDRLQTRWGIWLFPTVHDISFDEVRGLQLSKSISRGRRGRKNTNYNLDFQMADGRTESLSATNDLIEEAIDEIMTPLRERGIFLVDTTGEL